MFSHFLDLLFGLQVLSERVSCGVDAKAARQATCLSLSILRLAGSVVMVGNSRHGGLIRRRYPPLAEVAMEVVPTYILSYRVFLIHSPLPELRGPSLSDRSGSMRRRVSSS